MQIPQSITLIGSDYWLDGGTMTLYAVTEFGAQCTIQLNQRVFDGAADPGRLYLNAERVDVRSDAESQIINLLKIASVAPIEHSPARTENRISKNALILGDDIKEVMDNSPEDSLRKFRNEIIAFVASDEYVQIAEHGVSKQTTLQDSFRHHAPCWLLLAVVACLFALAAGGILLLRS